MIPSLCLEDNKGSSEGAKKQIHNLMLWDEPKDVGSREITKMWD